MAGRSGEFVNGSYEKFEYLPCYEECDFKANLPSHDPMIIYLCSPNNPTGTALNKKELTVWVKYAKQTGSVIFLRHSLRKTFRIAFMKLKGPKRWQLSSIHSLRQPDLQGYAADMSLSRKN